MICSFWNFQSVTQLFKTYFITKSVVSFEMVAFLVDWMKFKIKSAFSVQSFCTVTLDFVINSPEVNHLGFCLTRDDRSNNTLKNEIKICLSTMCRDKSRPLFLWTKYNYKRICLHVPMFLVILPNPILYYLQQT